MAPFIYFIPRKTREQLAAKGSIVKSEIEAAGLSHVFGDLTSTDDVAMTDIARGPDGLSGVIIVALPSDHARRFVQYYQPKYQTWEPLSDGAFIGYETNSPPQPADLQRKKIVRGYEVELGDGQRWQIPVLRRPRFAFELFGMSETELVRDLIYDSQNRVVEEVSRRHKPLYDWAEKLLDVFFEGDALRPTINCSVTEALDLTLGVLGVNYRIGPHEQNALNLVNSENAVTILGLSVDVWAIMERSAVLTAPQQQPEDSNEAAAAPETDAKEAESCA